MQRLAFFKKKNFNLFVSNCVKYSELLDDIGIFSWILLMLNIVGRYPTICVGKIGPLCNLCVESKESNGSPACETGIKARYGITSLWAFLLCSSCGFILFLICDMVDKQNGSSLKGKLSLFAFLP